jgi:hypothetical protein
MGSRVPYFDDLSLEHLRAEYDKISDKTRSLVDLFCLYLYRSEEAKEYGLNGICRRLFLLERCIQQIYTLIPIDLNELPSRDERLDATICLQAFVFNVFGVMNNLAFVWIKEKGVCKPDGRPLRNSEIGLKPNNDNRTVFKSFSAEMQSYLNEKSSWFQYLEDFRHSLAHRIPLYIPPYVVPFSQEAKYSQLEEKASRALHRGAIDAHDQLRREQDALTQFRPWMIHSFGEQSKPVVFHAQIINDFLTVEEIARKFVLDLAK